MSTNVVKMDKLINKLAKLGGNVDLTLEKSIARQAKFVQAKAKMLAPVDSGMLRQTISYDVKKEDNKIIGSVDCWSEYGAYVEFGTGPKGEKSHKGISPDVNISYRYDPWWIHASQVDEDTAEKYHWFYIDTPEGRFYKCYGQEAQPFMYPALKDTEKIVTKNIQKDIRKAIKEVAEK